MRRNRTLVMVAVVVLLVASGAGCSGDEGDGVGDVTTTVGATVASPPTSVAATTSTGVVTTSSVAPTTSSSVPTTSSAPSTTAGLVGMAGLVWRRVVSDAFACAEGTSMESVTVGGPGLVAVGWCGHSTDDMDGRIWVSADGSEWEKIDSPLLTGRDIQRITSVAAGDPGVVAVGFDYDRPTGTDGVVWSSVDGLEWERIDDPSFAGADQQEIWSVVWTGERFVAGGGDKASGARDLGVWVSEDGRTWTQLGPEVLPNSSDTGFMDAMDWNIAQSESVVVVVDSFGVWRSPDRGLSWEFIEAGPVAGVEGVDVGGFHTVATTDVGFVAIGLDPVTQVWTSTDGSEWEYRASLDPVEFGLEALDAVAGRGSWVAIGGTQHGEVTSDLSNALLISDDFTNWTPASSVMANPPGYIEVNAITDFGEGLIAVGSIGTGHPWQEAAVWIGQP